MLIAHLADLHLGYRAYHRVLPGGINARERDVAMAFRAALDKIIEIRPELIVVAGDVFHTVRPSNAAIADAFRQFSRLRMALPQSQVVIIAGNHDSPRSAETGSILRLFAEIPGIHVMDQDARVVHLEALQASVCGVPHAFLAGGQSRIPDPDPNANVNVLIAHGDVHGRGLEAKLRYISEYGGAPIDAQEIRPERWDYVALGHYHVVTELTPNMWYAGGIERTSTNVWEEKESKGFLVYDTDARKAEFHAVETRPVIDLRRFSALYEPTAAEIRAMHQIGNGQSTELDVDVPPAEPNGNGQKPTPAAPPPLYLDAAHIDARIRKLLDGIKGGIDGKIVRLVITDIPRDLLRELDHRTLRDYRARALHFHLDARRPETRRVGSSTVEGRRRTLEQEVEAFITQWRPTTSDIDNTRLLTLAHLYLQEARGLEPRAEDEPVE